MSNPSDVFIFLDSCCLCMFVNLKKLKKKIQFFIFLILFICFGGPIFGDYNFEFPESLFWRFHFF